MWSHTATARTREVVNRSVADVKAFMDGRRLDAYNLVDVREPGEFAGGHIPGAQLVPLGQLPGRVAELDPSKPTVVYCRAGARGMAGAGILNAAGFTEVMNIAGGMMAWDGHAVDGLPDAGWDWFAAADDVAGLLAHLWLLEEGARRFYEKAAEVVAPEVAGGFRRLVAAEAGHKDEVVKLYREVVGSEPDFAKQGEPERIEGGASLATALAWLERQDTRTIIEVAMALEATALDRYTQLSRLASEPEHRAIFKKMAEGERRHLEEVTALFTPRAV